MAHNRHTPTPLEIAIFILSGTKGPEALTVSGWLHTYYIDCTMIAMMVPCRCCCGGAYHVTRSPDVDHHRQARDIRPPSTVGDDKASAERMANSQRLSIS